MTEEATLAGVSTEFTQHLKLEVKPGDGIQANVCINNSEIGLDSLSVELLIYRLFCTNKMIAKDFFTRKYHVSRAADDNDFFLKVWDTAKNVVEVAKFS